MTSGCVAAYLPPCGGGGPQAGWGVWALALPQTRAVECSPPPPGLRPPPPQGGGEKATQAGMSLAHDTRHDRSRRFLPCPRCPPKNGSPWACVPPTGSCTGRTRSGRATATTRWTSPSTLARVLRTLGKALPLDQPLRRALDRLQQRAAVPHPGVGLPRRAVPAGHRGGGARRGRGAHPPAGHRPREDDPRQLPRGAPRRGRGGAVPRRTARRPADDARHAAPLALLQPAVVLARSARQCVPAPPGSRAATGAVRRHPRGLDGERERRPHEYDVAVQPLRREVLRPPQRPGPAGRRRGTAAPTPCSPARRC